jgi:hypothetical protein
MNFSDSEFAEFLRSIIREEVRKEIKLSATFDKTYFGTVTTVGSGTADVKLAGDDTTELTLRNDTGVALSPGDEVIITALNNNLNNATITIKK